MPEKTSFEVTKHNQRHPASDDVFKARSQERGRGAAGGRHSHESGYAEAILPLLGKPVFLRSLDVFQGMKQIVSSIVIVLDESFRDEYQHIMMQIDVYAGQIRQRAPRLGVQWPE